jgi:hypothetical protein
MIMETPHYGMKYIFSAEKTSKKRKAGSMKNPCLFKTSNQIIDGAFERHPIKLRPFVRVIIVMLLL